MVVNLGLITSISKQSLHALEQYHWPGNVRELEHLVERAVLSTDGEVLKVALPVVRVEPAMPIPSTSMDDKLPEAVAASSENGAMRLVSLSENELAHIRTVLRHTGGRISGARGAATILGIPPSTLRSRIKKLGLKIRPDDPR